MTSDDRTDRAWSVLVGAGLCMFCGQPAAVLFTFGLFAPAIAGDTAWSPSAVAAAIGPATIAAALLAPAAGRAADRLGVRRMAAWGGLSYGAGFVLLALLATQLWQFIALLTLLCVLGFAATPLLYAKLATGWFVRRRGLALSLVFSCTSIGIAFWPPVAARLIEAFGWRAAYLTIGLAAGSITSGAALLLLRDPPANVSMAGDEHGEGMTLRAALRKGAFWRIAAVSTLLTGALAGVTVSLPVFLRLEGVAPVTAASVLIVAGVAMFIGRISSGVILDRCFAPHVTAFITLLSIVAIMVLLMGSGVSSIYLAAALLGLGLGSEMDAAAYLTSRAFGQRSFGAIYGVMTLAYGLASAIGPATVGWSLSIGIAPTTIFLVGLALLVPVLVLVLGLRADDFPFGVDHRKSRLAMKGA